MPSLRFGVATADHQCEAYDGRDDIRDVWERVRGLVPRGKATDFWNRYAEDVELAKGLGCTAFRLSLSWARLEPEAGKWDEAAFAHYRDLLQSIRSAGMVAIVTLVHNTWPLHIEAEGDGEGLLHHTFPQRMAAYAQIVAQRLGDLIDYYVTLNEPNQLVYGWIKGFWMRSYAMPPGQPPYATGEEQMDDVLKLIPNLFRAHTQSRAAIQRVTPGAKCGTNPLVLGLPQWLQRWIDRNATHLQSPEQAIRQATKLQQSTLLEGGNVDISIAQITATKQREEHVLFSEPYYTAHLSLLHAAAKPLPADLERWTGTVGVVEGMLPARVVAGHLPAANVQYFDSNRAAGEALLAGKIDAFFDDDVTLKQFASDAFVITDIGARPQYLAVAMAFGSRSLLNAVDRALREFEPRHENEFPNVCNRKTLARKDVAGPVPDMDKSLKRIRKRGVLRVGVHPVVPGMCTRTADGKYVGLEPEIAHAIAAKILGDPSKVEFVEVHGDKRMSETRSWFQIFFTLRKSIGMFGTLLGTNWWNLGMAGKLPPFLCPPECVGTLDYVGIDYYWGVPTMWPGELHRLSAAADFRYANAPVWPGALSGILNAANKHFPGKPIIIVENGCVTSADGFSRANYIQAHVAEVRRAIAAGIPVEAYLCWSITSNREWGLHFDDNSDFGLYHIDLDTDPQLVRKATPASAEYARIIAG